MPEPVVVDPEDDVTGKEKIPRWARDGFGRLTASFEKALKDLGDKLQPVVDAMNEPYAEEPMGSQPSGMPGAAPTQAMYDPYTGQPLPPSDMGGYPYPQGQMAQAPQRGAAMQGGADGNAIGQMRRELAKQQAAMTIMKANPSLTSDVAMEKAEAVVRHMETAGIQDVQAALLQVARSDEDLQPFARSFYGFKETAPKAAPVEPVAEPGLEVAGDAGEKPSEDPDAPKAKPGKDQPGEGDGDKGKSKSGTPGASKTPSLPPASKEPDSGTTERVQAMEDKIAKEFA